MDVWLPGLILWLGVLYLPYIGRGFLKDDFRWIAESRITSMSDVWHVLTVNVGIYRPIVTLSFSANHAMFGLSPYGYALTNFFILVLCVWALRRFAMSLGLDRTTATVACALWALNFHGIGGSLLWISGRTSLFLTLFAVLCMTAWVRQRPAASAVWLSLALLSKEDAVMVPALMALWSTLAHRLRNDALRLLAIAVPIVILYAAAREASGAFSYWNAPPYYRLTSDISVIFRNVLEYADRNATLSLAGLLVLCVAARAMPRVEGGESKRLVRLGAAWAILTQLPTLALPARSSLSVLLPSVGVTLACAVLARSVWERRPARVGRRLVLGGVAVVIALWPVYHLRNQRLLRQARVSAAAVAALERLGPRAAGYVVVLRDDRTVRDNFAAAFGTLLPEVRRLVIPQAAAVWLEPPPLEGLPRPDGGPVLEIRLERDRVHCCRLTSWEKALRPE